MIFLYLFTTFYCSVNSNSVQGDKYNTVYANFTIHYNFVASDEIVVLQNAIEDMEKIVNMSVKKISMESDDVLPMPLNVTAEAKSSTSIKVNWLPVEKRLKINGSYYTTKGYTVFCKLYSQNIWERYATNSSERTMIITDLLPYSLYTIRMLAFHSGGNGISSEYIDIKTAEGVPSSAPKGLKCISESPTKIVLEWDSLNSSHWQGFAQGYKIRYRVYHEKVYDEKKVGSSATTATIGEIKDKTKDKELLQFTSYFVTIAAFTGVGDGTRSACVVKTQEGVPSAGPVITKAELDPDRPREATIVWDHIPDHQKNGDLVGYNLYYGVTRNGKQRTQYPTVVHQKVLDRYTNTFTITNMDIDNEIKVWIKGRTNVGEGESSEPAYVETCKCPRSVYAAWFPNPPYLEKDDKTVVRGIFKDYLDDMMKTLCGTCKSLQDKVTATDNKATKLYWDRSKDGHSPLRADEKRLKELVGPGIHFHVAMNGRSEIHNFQSDYRFVCIVHSPGIAFIVRDPLLELNKTNEIMKSLAQCWPAIIIIILFSMVSGIIMWVLDCRENAEEFPNESFLQGLYHGTYWAFVSMTTVGYGDKTPRSFLAQCVAISWMLMGPIINGIVIGAITTSLTTINLQADPKIYGSKVAAIADSFEYNLGVRRNAKMNETGKRYMESDELIEALENKEVNGVLVDSLVAANMAKKLVDKKMKISKIIPEKAGWGIILSDDMLKLEEEIRSYENNHAEEMKKLVQNKTKGLSVKAAPAQDMDTGLVDPKSTTFIGIVQWGLISIAICIVLAFIFEYGILKYRRAKVVPYTEAHRTLLEDDVAKIVTEFCDSVPEKLKAKTDEHESELKRFFWKKGYSFGIDGWLRQKTANEERIKKEIRYQEIMNEDLGLYKPQSVWSQGKTLVKSLRDDAQKATDKIKDKMDDYI